MVAVPAASQTTPSTPAVSILVADDFSPWRAQVRRILQAHPDWTVASEACDGQEAVQKAVALRPDVVLLDIGMPVLSGIEAARTILKDSPKSKVVFLTQCSDPEVMDLTLQLGAKAYLLKTRAARDLLPTIEDALRKTKKSRPPRPWRVVAEEVSREQDPAKLTELAEELNQALTEQDIDCNPKLERSVRS